MDIEKLNEALEIWNKPPYLDPNNYHNSLGFLSNSFIGSFINCEYAAIIDGALKEPSEYNEAFFIGHATEALIFNGQKGFDEVIQDHKIYVLNARKVADLKKDLERPDLPMSLLNKKRLPELQQLAKESGIDIYDKKKPKSAVYEAYNLAKSVIRHAHLKALLRAEGSIYHQVITFDLHGVKWRGEIDYLNLNKNTEIDLKTTASDYHERSWNEETKTKDFTFIDSWNYHRQRALYQVGIKQKYDQLVQPRILAVSKKTKSVRMFKFDDQERLDHEIRLLLPIVQRFKAVLDGDKPQQCETCKHCVESEDVRGEILTSKFCAAWY